MFKKSYVSPAFVDAVNSKNYAFGKINGVIIDDVDKNGFVDLVTFPSNFTHAVPLRPIVWLNTDGHFTATTIKGSQDFQFFRDSIAGDFNKDGFRDYIQVDQGWELNGRDPNSFYGATPVLLKGTPTGLTWVGSQSFLSAVDGGKTFNHIGTSADYDNDGDLDIAIAAFTPHASNQFRLYENDGTGKFTWKSSSVDLPDGDPSGVTFIKLGNNWSLVTATYRSFDSTDPLGTHQPWVLTYDGNQFVKSYEINRPDLGGRERNYGAADMYNRDLNSDGREDLIVLWETEALNGIDDGLSNIENGVFGGQTRYKDLSDTIATVYMQKSDGSLEHTPVVYNLHGRGSGWHLYFLDLNNDGHIDFYNSSYSVEPANYHKMIWINDGTGKFAQLTSPIVTESFEPWYQDAPYFFDANNDGKIDVVSLRPVFGDDYSTRSIGEEIRVFINDSKTESGTANSTTNITGTPGKDKLIGTDGGDIISGDLGVDKIYGKHGADQFVFDTPTYIISKTGKFKSNKNQDIIYDFDPSEDRLVFDTEIFSLFADDEDWTDNVAGSFVTQDTNDWLVYDAGRIYYDFNGSATGGQSLVAQLIGSPELTFDNVMFI